MTDGGYGGTQGGQAGERLGRRPAELTHEQDGSELAGAPVGAFSMVFIRKWADHRWGTCFGYGGSPVGDMFWLWVITGGGHVLVLVGRFGRTINLRNFHGSIGPRPPLHARP